MNSEFHNAQSKDKQDIEDVDMVTNKDSNEFSFDKLFDIRDGKYEGRIKSMNEVAELLGYLQSKNEKEEKKGEVIALLIEQFYNYPLLIDIICSQKMNNSLSLSEIVIMNYMDITESERDIEATEASIELKQKMLELLALINDHIDIPRNGYVLVYQHFAKYYRKENNNTLKDNQLISLMKLLSVLYGNKEILKKEYINSNKQKNYFYFNADTNIRCNLSDSTSNFSCWTAIFLLKMENTTFEQHQSASLIEFTTDQSNIELIYNNEKLLLYYQHLELYESVICPLNKWIIIKLSISLKEYYLKLIGRDVKEIEREGKFNEPRSYNEKIITIRFLKNFVGLVSSVVFKSIYLDTSSQLRDKLNKEEEFLNLLKHNISEDIQLIVIPEFFNPKYNSIDSNTNIIKAKIISMNQYINMHFANQNVRNVPLVGGINNLLPILEMMYTSKLLTSENLKEFLFICHTILSKSFSNLYNAIENSFFHSLSLFLERIPSELFTKNVFGEIIKINECIIEFARKMEGSPLVGKIKKFYKYIFLNEKIISKFPYSIQPILWSILLHYTKEQKILLYVSLDLICNILRINEENRYSHFCCLKHKQYYSQSSNTPIMEPHLNVVYKKIKKLLIIYIVNSKGTQSNHLIQLLYIDITPCLRRAIISIIKTLVLEEQSNIIENLLKNGLIEALEFSFVIGYLDLKVRIIKIFTNLMNKHNDLLCSFFSLKENKVSIWVSMNQLFNIIETNLFSHCKFVSMEDSHLISINEALTINNKIKKRKTSITSLARKDMIIEKKEDTILKRSASLESKISSIHIKIRVIKKEEEEDIHNEKVENQNQGEPDVKTPEKKEKTNFSNSGKNKNNIQIDNKNQENSKQELKLKQKIKENAQIFHFRNFEANNDYFSIYSKEYKEKKIKSYFNSLVSFIFHPFQYKNLFKLTSGLRIIQKFLSINLEAELVKEYINKLVQVINSSKQNEFIEINSEHIFLFEWLFDVVFHFKACLNFNWFEEHFTKSDKAVYNDIISSSLKIYSILIGKIDFNLVISIINSFFNLAIHKKIVFKGSKFPKHISKLVDEVIFDFLSEKGEKVFRNKSNINKREEFASFYSILMEYILLYDSEFNLLQENNEYLQKIDKIFPHIFFSSIKMDYNLSTKKYDLSFQMVGLFMEVFMLNKKFENLYKEKYKSKTKERKMKEFENLIKINYQNDYSKEINLLLSKKERFPLIMAIAYNFALLYTFSDKTILQILIQQNEHFIFFVILCCIIPQKDHTIETEIRKYFPQVILFSLMFLFCSLGKEDDQYFKESIKWILAFCSISLQTIKKNQRKNFFNNMLYQLFNNILVDKSNNKIFDLDINKLMDLEQDSEFFNEYKNLFLNLDSGDIIESLNFICDRAYYKNLTFQRYTKLCHIVPFYNYTTTFEIEENNSTNKFKLNLTNNFIPSILVDNMNAFYSFSTNKLKYYYNQKEKELLNQLKLKKNYKKQKKKLFSWREMWSDKTFFYSHINKLKEKILSHYSLNLSLPLLTPIIDIDYNLPTFSNFDTNELFKLNDPIKNYKINLDIDSILGNEQKAQPPIGKNYLYQSYKSISKGILWNEYEKMRNFNIEDYLYKKKSNGYFNCCLLKSTRHIYGKISVQDGNITFTRQNSPENHIKQLKFYDPFKKTCFGSFFKTSYKDKDFLPLKVKKDEIKYIFYRTYYFIDRAIEIFTEKNKGYYFIFESKKKRGEFIRNIENFFHHITTMQQGIEILLGLARKEPINLKHFYDKWQTRQLSTFNFLLWCNTFAKRSYKDLSQYPVFPWTLKNYNQTEVNIKEDKRDFSIPMGMMELDKEGIQRKQLYIKNFEDMKNENKEDLKNSKYHSVKGRKKKIEPNKIPFFYGSHYSNPLYVCHYLLRIFPFSFIGIELQGRSFDNPNRIFKSIANSFKSASSQKTDIRELIPEFFFLSELFKNINNLKLKLGDEDNVTLPPFAKGNAYNFVIQMRKSLEDVNANVNKWVDLIFGIKQNGSKAEEAKNIFLSESYYGVINEQTFEKEGESIQGTLLKAEIGITPHQIFFSKIKDKITPHKAKIFNLTHDIDKQLKIIPIALIIKNEYKFSIIFDNLTIKKFKISKFHSTIENYKEKKIKHKNVINVIKQFGIPPIIKNNQYEKSLIYLEKSKMFLMGGFYNGKILFFNLHSSREFFQQPYENKTPIVCIAMDKNESLIIMGDKQGSIIIYMLSNQKSTYYQRKNDHDKEITSIVINHELNVFATAAMDGYVMLYIYPQCVLIRSINLNMNTNEPFFTPNTMWISNSPIPSIVVYEKESNSFKSFTINGTPIEVEGNGMNNEAEKIGEKEEITAYLVLNSTINFGDYLIAGNNKGQIEIFEFPSMKSRKKVTIFTISEDKNSRIQFIQAFNRNSSLYIVSYDNKIWIGMTSEICEILGE